MTPPTTRLVQQPVLLEPDRAKALDALSKELKTPKQVLLREAVDDLLAKRGMITSEAYEHLRDVLKRALAIVRRFESRNDEYLWARKCFTSRREIDEMLEQLAGPKED